MSSAIDVLAIAAHPDDVEISCGGLLIRMADHGYKTGILDLTLGEMGTRGSPEVRQQEAAVAAQVMGLTVRENANLPDARLALNDESRAIVATFIRRLRPTLAIIPSHGQRHPDHNAAGEIAYAGIFVAGLKKLPAAGEPHRPDKILYTCGRGQRPTFYIDITAQMDRKKQAVSAYRSQFGGAAADAGAHEDAMSAVASLARYCGSLCGTTYAEAYCIKEPVLIHDPISELRLKSI